MPDNLRVLGNVSLPEKVALVLKNGPKFSVVPKVSAHELLALNRGISCSADEENCERCLPDGADSLLRNRRNDRPTLTTGGVVSYFKEHELSLLLSDKEGGFVVMYTSSFLDKASSAIMKNFEPTTVKASKRLKGERRMPEPLQGQRKRPHVVPYMHKIFHNLKKVAKSAPCAGGLLCAE
ncbi:hypothetical protein HPB51_009303 [Rhipicephalus microplus]|uniref:Tick transposon n=1 Tax=Rhipicephalus microplus TaxID=6941 RepID=A0A9J6F0L5_RHIMP|nr:hypothetical protein HPB51_009303 [Rhipicephalus microplus]